MSVRLPRWGLAVLAGAALAAPAPVFAQRVDEPGDSVGRALQQPFRDLNLVRPNTAKVLQAAADNPYDDTGLADCPSVRARIVELESVLGPDIDVSKRRGETNAGEQLAAGAVDNIVSLPFAGVIRRLTGAHSQDLAHRRAVLAGMVRRGYLNGVWRSMGCDRPQVAAVAPLVDTAFTAPPEAEAVPPDAAPVTETAEPSATVSPLFSGFLSASGSTPPAP